MVRRSRIQGAFNNKKEENKMMKRNMPINMENKACIGGEIYYEP